MNVIRLQLNSSKTGSIKYDTPTQLRKCTIKWIDIIENQVNETTATEYFIYLVSEMFIINIALESNASIWAWTAYIFLG